MLLEVCPLPWPPCPGYGASPLARLWGPHGGEVSCCCPSSHSLATWEQSHSQSHFTEPNSWRRVLIGWANHVLPLNPNLLVWEWDASCPPPPPQRKSGFLSEKGGLDDKQVQGTDAVCVSQTGQNKWSPSLVFLVPHQGHAEFFNNTS